MLGIIDCKKEKKRPKLLEQNPVFHLAFEKHKFIENVLISQNVHCNASLIL